MKEIYISFRKRIFQCFSLHFHVLIENEGKSKKYISLLLQFIFISLNCINYPFFSVIRRNNISSMKDHLFLAKKQGIYAITRKIYVPFHRKSRFFNDCVLISLFSYKINKKQRILQQYSFFLKK